MSWDKSPAYDASPVGPRRSEPTDLAPIGSWAVPCVCGDAHPPERECALAAAQARAAARASKDDDEGSTTFWAEIELPSGQVVQRTTTRASIARSWHEHLRNRVVREGTGVPVWEIQHAAPAAPQAVGDDLVPCELASGEPAAPIIEDRSAEAAPATQPAGAGEPVAGPEITIDEMLAQLVNDEDLRISSAAQRIVRYRAEAASGVYLPPRFKRPKPNLGPGF